MIVLTTPCNEKGRNKRNKKDDLHRATFCFAQNVEMSLHIHRILQRPIGFIGQNFNILSAKYVPKGRRHVCTANKKHFRSNDRSRSAVFWRTAHLKDDCLVKTKDS